MSYNFICQLYLSKAEKKSFLHIGVFQKKINFLFLLVNQRKIIGCIEYKLIAKISKFSLKLALLFLWVIFRKEFIFVFLFFCFKFLHDLCSNEFREHFLLLFFYKGTIYKGETQTTFFLTQIKNVLFYRKCCSSISKMIVLSQTPKILSPLDVSVKLTKNMSASRSCMFLKHGCQYH